MSTVFHFFSITGIYPFGTGSTVILLKVDDTQPAAFVTVNEYVPGERPESVVFVPLPEEVPAEPAFSIQSPEGGRLPMVMLPVVNRHVGWTMFTAAGIAGISGGTFITISADDTETQPLLFVTE